MDIPVVLGRHRRTQQRRNCLENKRNAQRHDSNELFTWNIVFHSFSENSYLEKKRKKLMSIRKKNIDDCQEITKYLNK